MMEEKNSTFYVCNVYVIYVQLYAYRNTRNSFVHRFAKTHGLPTIIVTRLATSIPVVMILVIVESNISQQIYIRFHSTLTHPSKIGISKYLKEKQWLTGI